MKLGLDGSVTDGEVLSYPPQGQFKTLTASTAMPVPAATSGSAFVARGSPWAKPYPPITMAIRDAILAMVPVKKFCGFLEPVSSGEPDWGFRCKWSEKQSSGEGNGEAMPQGMRFSNSSVVGIGSRCISANVGNVSAMA